MLQARSGGWSSIPSREKLCGARTREQGREPGSLTSLVWLEGSTQGVGGGECACMCACVCVGELRWVVAYEVGEESRRKRTPCI